MLAQTLDSEREAALSLLSSAAVRERAHEMLDLGLAGSLAHFHVLPEQLAATADFVAEVIRGHYPDLAVPLHARWRHFVFDGRDFWAEIERKARWPNAAARARAAFDLATVSVLLDAGAGPEWRYRDPHTGVMVGRSEGLALASLRMFEAGLFSADPGDRLRVDARRLTSLSAADLQRGFDVSERNPLVGLEGRAALLSRLGEIMLANGHVFARQDSARPGGLFDDLTEAAGDKVVPAPAILRALLLHLAPMWSNRVTLAHLPLGDTWRHAAIRRSDLTDGLVPLHKLSQWLAYSLIEPLGAAGIAVSQVDGLTGLAEYRNGGLFVDMGVLPLRDPAQAGVAHSVDSELIVEWRALTVALIDRLAPLVRERLGLRADAFPLGALLEGGTWAAGRKIARELRPDGRPPFIVISDGTVF